MSLDATQGRLQQMLQDQAAKAKLADATHRLFGAGNRTAVRPTDAAQVGITKTVDADLRVREGKWDDGSVCVEVAVYSMMRPGAFKRVRLDRRSPTFEVQVAAGACAEGCAEEFKDPYDPDREANRAPELFERLRAG